MHRTRRMIAATPAAPLRLQSTLLSASYIASLMIPLLLAPVVQAVEEFIPLDEYVADDGMNGDALYDRMLENRFESYEQKLSMQSGDRGGNFQNVQMRVRYKNYRADSKRIISKTIAKYFAPHDVRHLGYLVINNADGRDDQFVYRPSGRKVRRINVRGEAIAGTDFAFEDVIPQEFEDGRHFRLADALVPDAAGGEINTYVVAVVPRPRAESEYSKFVLYLEKQHFVPIRAVYWDNKRVKIKQMNAETASITRYEDMQKGSPKEVWIANQSRMQHLKMMTFTELKVDELAANPGLRDRDFSQRELTASH